MNEIKPCPFCGNKDRFVYRFKNDSRKVNGIYYKICTLECLGCTASIRQAGPTKEIAEEYAIRQWNMRDERRA